MVVYFYCMSSVQSTTVSDMQSIATNEIILPLLYKYRISCSYRWLGNIKMDLKKYDGTAWTGLLWLRIEASG